MSVIKRKRARTASIAVVVVGASLVVATPVGRVGAVPTSVSPVSDAASADDEASARGIAHKFGHAVVVDSMTTATQQTSALPDGTMQLVEAASPVRVKQHGRWAQVDKTLERGSDGFAGPAAVTTQVRFSLGGDGPIAKVQTASGAWLSLSWNGGPLPAAALSGESALYSNVFPGVDLRLASVNTGMTEVLVVKNAEAALDSQLKSVVFSIAGASAKPDAAGGMTAMLPDGSSLFSGSPNWWDAAGGGTADGPGGNRSVRPVPSALITSTAMTVDAATPALTSEVTYPVFVDPDMQWTGSQQHHDYVDVAYPNTSYFDMADSDDTVSHGALHTGYISAAAGDGVTHVTRSFVQMDVSAVLGKHVLQADFNITNIWSYSCTAENVVLQQVTPISSGTTWNSQPDVQWDLDHKSFAYGYPGCAAAQSVGFNATGSVGHGGVTDIVAAGYSNITLQLATCEDHNTCWKKFTASSAQLTIHYNTPPTGIFYNGMSSGCFYSAGLRPGAVLRPNDALYSDNGRYMLTMQSDGNLVIYDVGTSPWTALWSSGTRTLAENGTATFQADGNLVIYDRSNVARWSSGTWGHPGGRLVLQDDHNLVIYEGTNGYPIWGAGSWGPLPPGSQLNPPSSRNCVSAINTPTISATGSDADAGTNLQYNFEVWQYRATGLTLVASTWTSPVATGASANWQTPLLPDGRYFARERTFDGVDYGPYTTDWLSFVVDTAVPALPSVQWASTAPTTVGRPASVTFRPGAGGDVAGSDPVSSYVYWWTPTASTIGSTMVVPANPPGCGGQYKNVTTICPAKRGDVVTLTVASPDETSTLWVATMNRAGTYSQNSAHQVVGANLPVTVNADAAAFSAGHGWSDDWISPTSTTAVNDSVKLPVTPTPTPTPFPMVFAGATVAKTTDQIAPTPLPRSRTLAFSGNTPYAQTSSHVLDTSKPFTVSAWVKPTLPNGNSWPNEAAISGDGTYASNFQLDYVNNGTRWRFCMTTVNTMAPPLDCVSSASAVLANGWTFLSATWDPTSTQLRLYVNTDVVPAIAQHLQVGPLYPAMPDGVLAIGRAQWNNAGTDYFQGQLAYVSAVQGVLSSGQRKVLYNRNKPA